MRNFLKQIKVLQEVNNKDRKLGKGYLTAYRLNPYNPLSYLTIIIGLLVGFILFGVKGIKNEMDLTNPFKWN